MRRVAFFGGGAGGPFPGGGGWVPTQQTTVLHSYLQKKMDQQARKTKNLKNSNLTLEQDETIMWKRDE